MELPFEAEATDHVPSHEYYPDPPRDHVTPPESDGYFPGNEHGPFPPYPEEDDHERYPSFEEDHQVDSPGLVHKHVYLHVPPPDLEEDQQHHQVTESRPREKHYRIIFIKTPSTAGAAALATPTPPPKEEKTLIYVLVRKPDEEGPQIPPEPQPTQPSKPEVYFIKYKPVLGESGQEKGGDGGQNQGPGYLPPSGFQPVSYLG